MAVANTKSTAITNADATPVVLTNSAFHGGVKYVAKGICEVLAADDYGSVYRFVRLPSNAIIHSIKIRNDAITGGTSYDCGIYRTAADGGAVVDAYLFASAVDISAGLAGTELRFEAATTAIIDYAEYRLWQIADVGAATYATDPGFMFDLCLTANTVGSSAGTILLEVEYSV